MTKTISLTDREQKYLKELLTWIVPKLTTYHVETVIIQAEPGEKQVMEGLLNKLNQ